jgi:hypothetical protein
MTYIPDDGMAGPPAAWQEGGAGPSATGKYSHRLEGLHVMSMVCPQCNGSFSQRIECPSCRVRLEYHAGNRRARSANSSGQFAMWQETPWGRLLVGLLLAQGLYYGLWHLCKAGLMAVNDPATKDVWQTLYGLLLMQGFQVTGLLVGGALAGAGRRQGPLYGGIVGLVNGIIFVLVQRTNLELFTPITLYGQPVLQTACGALGGLLGCVIWRPLPTLAVPNARQRGPRGRQSGVLSLFRGRVNWLRILVGVAMVVGGTLFANAILDLVLDASEGKLTIDTHLQAHLVTWEITALAMFLGSGVAGTNSDNGLKHGLFAGLLAAMILLGFNLAQPRIQVHFIVMNFLSAVTLCMAGGWFGGELIPPRVRPAPRKKIFEAP